jgi:hypothetical protein
MENLNWDNRYPSQGRNRHLLNVISENCHYTKLLVEVVTNILAELQLVFQSAYNEWSKIYTTLYAFMACTGTNPPLTLHISLFHFIEVHQTRQVSVLSDFL